VAEAAPAQPTNIAIIARSVAHTHTLADGSTIPQIVIYSQGVGSNVPMRWARTVLSTA
jgi:hypothetical protein